MAKNSINRRMSRCSVIDFSSPPHKDATSLQLRPTALGCLMCYGAEGRLMSQGAARKRAPKICNDQRLGRARPSPRAFSPIRRILVFALPLALAACMVGPDFKSADAPVAEQWLEAGNPAVKTDR